MIPKPLPKLPEGFCLFTTAYTENEDAALAEHFQSYIAARQFKAEDMVIVRVSREKRFIAVRETALRGALPQPVKLTDGSKIRAQRGTLATEIARHGLGDAFRAVATPDATHAEISAWIREQPQLQGVYVPAELRWTRAKLGCPGRQGGLKPKPGRAAGLIRVRKAKGVPV